MRVDEGKNSWNLSAINMKAPHSSGEGGEEPASDPGSEFHVYLGGGKEKGKTRR